MTHWFGVFNAPVYPPATRLTNFGRLLFAQHTSLRPVYVATLKLTDKERLLENAAKSHIPNDSCGHMWGTGSWGSGRWNRRKDFMFATTKSMHLTRGLSSNDIRKPLFPLSSSSYFRQSLTKTRVAMKHHVHIRKNGEIRPSVARVMPDGVVETCGPSWQISQPPRVNHGGTVGLARSSMVAGWSRSA